MPIIGDAREDAPEKVRIRWKRAEYFSAKPHCGAVPPRKNLLAR